MKAIQIKDFGGPEELYLGDYETPTPAANTPRRKAIAQLWDWRWLARS